MRKLIRKDNRGISLVEVMVVVAIIVVLGAVGIWGVNAISGKPAEQCAQQIIYSLERHRTSAMGKVNAKYVLYVDGSGKIMVDEYLTNNAAFGAPIRKIEVGATRNVVTYTTSTGATYDLESNPLTLRFDRGSGSFQKLADGSYCQSISIKRGGREYTVAFVPLTGKVYLD